MSTFDTQYTADCVEFCPLVDNSSVLACGTYQLNAGDDQTPSSKVGRLYFFDINEPALRPFVSLDTSAILDIKWSSRKTDDSGIIGQVSADGKLSFVKLNFGTKTASVAHSVSTGFDMALSLDWSDRTRSSGATNIATSHDAGNIAVWDVSNSADVQQVRTWTGHQHECWIVAYNCHQEDVIWSGADDCYLKGWDLRDDSEKPTFSKRFSMGVTCIESSPYHPHLVAVGSYDESISIFDDRAMPKPLCTGHTDGGGVWRVRWRDPACGGGILAACMHKGFQAWSFQDNKLECFAKYQDPHSSLGYGIDWCRDPKRSVVGCCSFYDHLLSIWRLP